MTNPSVSTSTATLTTTASSSSTNHHQLTSNGVFDLIMCKLITPYHIINDPRLLDCGFSACYSCILACKDADKNLKCIFCNNIHKVDTNKLQINKNLHNFLKLNLKQNFNQNLMKQFEDSITLCTIEDKTQSGQAMDNESLDEYLNSIEADVQIKINAIKSNLEKFGDQFMQNIKNIRKELHKKLATYHKEYESKFNIYKQLIETTNQNMKEKYENGDPYQLNNLFGTYFIDNKLQLPQHQQQSQQQTTQNHALIQQHQHRTNAPTNHTHFTQQQQQQSVLNINATNPSKSNLLNDSPISLNAINDQSNFNFQSPSFHEDLDEFETDFKSSSTNKALTNQVTKRHLNKEQAQFNKFVREEVTKRFGENFLLQHEVNQLESSIMEIIKNEAISTYLPKNTSPGRAWTLAKVSLRSLKRDLRRRQTHLYDKKADCQKLLTSHSYYDTSGLH